MAKRKPNKEKRIQAGLQWAQLVMRAANQRGERIDWGRVALAFGTGYGLQAASEPAIQRQIRRLLGLPAPRRRR